MGPTNLPHSLGIGQILSSKLSKIQISYIWVVVDLGFYYFVTLITDYLVECMFIEESAFAIPAQHLFLS